jgi:hypothetical protein
MLFGEMVGHLKNETVLQNVKKVWLKVVQNKKSLDISIKFASARCKQTV